MAGQRVRNRAGQNLQKRAVLARQLGFLGPYVAEYRRVCARARREHPSLLGIFECDDEIFYEADAEVTFKHFGLGHMRQVILDLTDKLDFSADPSIVGEEVNKRHSKPDGVSVTGRTTILTDGLKRHTAIFMRAITGGDDNNPEVRAGLKLTALLHELGHVTDIEQGINFRETSAEVIKAEVFAHHFACREMVKARYRLCLGYYLDGLEEMAGSPSEYVRLAAREVIHSAEYARYRGAVSPLYGNGRRTG